MFVEAAFPGLDDVGIARAGIALPYVLDLSDMIGDGHRVQPFLRFPQNSPQYVAPVAWWAQASCLDR